ncbi:MAG TPA: hypothetical protein VF111_03925, partial [Thermoanaerobaculia bacterium]
MTVQAISTAYELELRRVRLLLRRRVAALRKEWEGDDATVISDAQIERVLADRAEDAVDPAWLFEMEEIERALAEQHSPLDELCAAFSLTPLERQMVTFLFAAELDPRLELLFGYLHDDASRKYVSAWLVWSAAATP